MRVLVHLSLFLVVMLCLALFLEVVNTRIVAVHQPTLSTWWSVQRVEQGVYLVSILGEALQISFADEGNYAGLWRGRQFRLVPQVLWMRILS